MHLLILVCLSQFKVYFDKMIFQISLPAIEILDGLGKKKTSGKLSETDAIIFFFKWNCSCK